MKTGFRHFLDFGTSDVLDIACNDSTKCFSTFGNEVLVILSSFIPSIGLVLHILIDIKDTQVLMIIKMLGWVINYA